MRHLLVTNDFPPKLGGIQSYLWELWRRLPPEEVAVLTSPHPDATEFDLEQDFRVSRVPEPVLLPSPVMSRRISRLAGQFGAGAVVLDPALPLGWVGPGLGKPYAVILHGAEVTVPGRMPVTRSMLRKVIGHASLAVAAGGYPESEARRVIGSGPLPPIAQIPPGVDVDRFSPMPQSHKVEVRARLGLPTSGPMVLCVSRLVPRKGMDTLIATAGILAKDYPDLTVVIAGAGRDQRRLEHLVRRSGAPVRLLGRVPAIDLPGLYASADVFAMSCRSRWAGLEQEGFGIVFLEAAASGVPSVAGDSGGAADAVVDGETGLVVSQPEDPAALAASVRRLLDDPELASRQGRAARQRAETVFAYDVLAKRLQIALEVLDRPRSPS